MPVCIYNTYIAQKWEKENKKGSCFLKFFFWFLENISLPLPFGLCKESKKSGFLCIILLLDIENQTSIIINTNNKKTHQTVE